MQPIRLNHHPLKKAIWDHQTLTSSPARPNHTLNGHKKEKALVGKHIIDTFQENLPEGYLLLKVRKDGKFVHTGKAEFMGYPIQKWIHQNPYLSAWLSNEKCTKDKAQRNWLHYLENVQKPIRIWFHYPGSTLAPIPLEIYRQFWDESKDEQDSVLLLIRDLTNEYRIRVKSRLESADAHWKIQKQRADFSAHLHDWKVPLTTIESSAWLCQKYNDDGQQEKRNKHLKRIQSAVADLKMDFQNWQIWNEPNSTKDYQCLIIRDFVEKRIEALTSNLKPRQKITYWHQGTETIHTDPYALRHILDNLISNAIKYSPEGSKISIKVWATEKEVRFQVMDQGIGIAKDEIPHLTESRFRARNSNGIPGNGLGLANVLKLIKRLGGTLDIQSTENVGSTFIITIKNQP